MYMKVDNYSDPYQVIFEHYFSESKPSFQNKTLNIFMGIENCGVSWRKSEKTTLEKATIFVMLKVQPKD